MAAYVLFDIDVTDPDAYAGYRELSGPSVEQYGGRYLVRGGATTELEGAWPTARFVVLEFPTAEQARAWYDGPEYTAARAVRQAASTGRGLLVEGV